MAKPVVTETGQAIVCEYTPAIFPLVMRMSSDGMTAKSLNKSKVDAAVIAVKQALSRYPESFLKKYVKTIYILDGLTTEGVSIGGTIWWWAGIVYICLPDNDMVWLCQALYHEVGHLVSEYPASRFVTQDWSDLNTASFRYGKGGFEAIKAGQQRDSKRTNYYAQGVVSQYAKSSVEEDFAELSERLMSGKKEFWAAVDKYLVLRKKVAFAIKTYANLDSTFTEAYFRGLPLMTSEVLAVKYKPGDTITFPHGGEVTTISPSGGKPTIVKVKPDGSVVYSVDMIVVFHPAPIVTLFPDGGTYQPLKGAPVPIPAGNQLLIYADGSYAIKPIEAKK